MHVSCIQQCHNFIRNMSYTLRFTTVLATDWHEKALSKYFCTTHAKCQTNEPHTIHIYLLYYTQNDVQRLNELEQSITTKRTLNDYNTHIHNIIHNMVHGE